MPSLALLRQIKSNWNEAYNTKFIRLNVCSEKDIDKDIDHITEQLQADDDVIIVKEFLHGAKEALMMSNDNVRRMLTNI